MSYQRNVMEVRKGLLWIVMLLIVAITVVLIYVIVYLESSYDTAEGETRMLYDVLYVGTPTDETIAAIGGTDALVGSALVIGINYRDNKLSTSGFGSTPAEVEIENLGERLAHGDCIFTTYNLPGTDQALNIRFIPQRDVGTAKVELILEDTDNEIVDMEVLNTQNLSQVFSNVVAT